MRADRLLAVLGLLQAHGKLSSKEIAEKLEVSERTIHRDMQALSVAGIPVYADRGNGGGWSLPEGYRSRLTGMTAGEISSLLFLQASDVVRDLGLAGSTRTAMNKLLSALPPAARRDAEIARERLHVDGAGWHDAGPRDAGSSLAVVQEAVWAARKLRAMYRSSDGEAAKERLLRPLGLVVKSGIWYVMALAEPDDEVRTYRVSRMEEARMTDDAFERPEGFDLAAAWEASLVRFRDRLPRYDATVLVAASAWSRFGRERFVTVGRHADRGWGWIEAEAEFNTLDSAVGVLLGYGSLAKAVAPQELRARVAEEARAVAAAYAEDAE
ncbi:Predicted DNA-binding transcriptional regulator YafY, contains an HTH and WYL domains [Paenibacillus sp. UNC496MF]|uniref:helix-turn-helix transcriptional regulator n=1 Tax=Paenibacillus sp. UNC496MF TaxID=1502753 RepID=UPI0008ECCA0D|nr:WYL domain-containing protein [Paenibacillus sp. UNC496MF]SFJ23738.1 Predicted DNA-binding transcriptional regulator YafY, contains an HTH and WYL domains [Paenibacillus sp. UNC496MF]